MYTYAITKDQLSAWELVFNKRNDWRKEGKYNNTDFSYGIKDNDKAKIMPYASKNLKYFHRKYIFFDILKDNNVSCIPETYFSVSEFKKKRNGLFIYGF